MTFRASSAEMTFLRAWDKYQCFGTMRQTDPATEWEFTLDGDEKYRLDFAWPSLMVAVEVQGFGYGHQRIAGLKRDADKARLAIEYGWTVLFFTPACLGSEADRELAVWQVCNTLFEKGNPEHEPLHEQACRAPEADERTSGDVWRRTTTTGDGADGPESED